MLSFCAVCGKCKIEVPEVRKKILTLQTFTFLYFLQGKVATSEEEEEDVAPVHVVNTDIGEMPEGAEVSDGEEPDSRPNDDPHKALDINLDEYVLHKVIG
jgi:AP-3 complex subunit delta-1